MIVGVNKYRLADEDPIDILDVDNRRGARGADRADRARSRPAATRRRARRRSTRCAKAREGNGNLLALAVECARARATLGEICRRWRTCSAATARSRRRCRASTAAPMTTTRAGTRLIDGVARDRAPARPQAAHAGRQDGAGRPRPRRQSRLARRSAISASRSCRARCSRRPQEAAALALEQDVDVVGASSLAAGHKTLIPELIGHLRDAGRADIKVDRRRRHPGAGL